METVYLSIGSNEDDRRNTIEKAISMLSQGNPPVLKKMLKIDVMRENKESPPEPYDQYGDKTTTQLTKQDAIFQHFLKNIKVSRLYETEPWGEKARPWYLNAVVGGETELSPEELLRAIQHIENSLGRDRSIPNNEPYPPRPIDIDILFYGERAIKTRELVVPHPRLQDRIFVILPLAEVAPKKFLHPILKKTVWELLQECKDASEIKQYRETAGY